VTQQAPRRRGEGNRCRCVESEALGKPKHHRV
jgi:hypothetical protein